MPISTVFRKALPAAKSSAVPPSCRPDPSNHLDRKDRIAAGVARCGQTPPNADRSRERFRYEGGGSLRQSTALRTTGTCFRRGATLSDRQRRTSRHMSGRNTHQFFHLPGSTLRTLGRLTWPDQQFRFTITFRTAVLKNRHRTSLTKGQIQRGPGIGKPCGSSWCSNSDTIQFCVNDCLIRTS